jgi:hypothetical protein
MGRLGNYILWKLEQIAGEDFAALNILDFAELLALMDEYVKPDKEQEWLTTALPALGGQRPIDLIRSNQMRPLIAEFWRLVDGQPV